MTNAACNSWSGLFSVGDDFEDEDLQESDWTPASDPLSMPGSSTPITSTQQKHYAPPVNSQYSSAGPGCSLTKHNLPDFSTAKGLRSLSDLNSSSLIVPQTPTPSTRAALGPFIAISSRQCCFDQPNPSIAVDTDPPQDDFDDWVVDLEELDETLFQHNSKTQAAPNSISPPKRMRSSVDTDHTTPVVSSLREFCSTTQKSKLPQSAVEAPCPSTVAVQAHPQSPGQYFVRTSTCQFSSPLNPGSVRASSEWQKGAVSQRAPVRSSESLFQATSPTPSSAVTPPSVHTPVLTNHLVQLVSATSKTPQRPQSKPVRSKARRFPGPAGALPQQTSGGNLDDIVVTVPQMPAHGAVACLQNVVPNSQVSEEEEFIGGPWAAMKADMGLDEKNPSCFLHSYSIVMVLRKAALRQLVKNKVPNMAVLLKSILHTHADAKAVFRDPTGEIQGTVHRRLLEDRHMELKTGAILLLKQVGVFSPSPRNHYLNVTPNNLLKIYPPNGALHASSHLSQPLLDTIGSLQCGSSRCAGGPVSQMKLHYDDNEEEQIVNPVNLAAPGNVEVQFSEPEASVEVLWDADDLDKLLGELPVE